MSGARRRLVLVAGLLLCGSAALALALQGRAPRLPGLVWVQVPGGSFEMGCKVADALCDPTELPRRRVAVAAFELTDSEITQEQFWQLTGRTPSYFRGCPRCPVESVTWHDADRFCRRLGGRLPTEAEWEFAARAGGATPFACGDGPSCLDTTAWYHHNAAMRTHPVKQKAPNAHGLHDMTGNVWEWVQDRAGGGEEEPARRYRLLRGGDWYTDNTMDLRVSTSCSLEPGLHDYGLGFRCAR